MDVTPQWATKVLERRSKRIEEGAFNQRPINGRKVQEYARDMLNGNWALNHQGIAFDENDDLMDGQHRLAAIQLCGIPIRMQVSTGYPVKQSGGSVHVKTIDSIDRGNPRKIGQQLGMAHGYTNANNFAANAKAIAEFITDRSDTTLTTAQTLYVLDIYGSSIEAIFRRGSHHKSRVSYICAPLAMYHSASPAKAETFAESFFKLEGLASGNPALTLHRYTQNNQFRNGNQRVGIMKAVASALCHFDRNSSITKIYQSQEAWTWLVGLQKANARKIRELVQPISFKELALKAA